MALTQTTNNVDLVVDVVPNPLGGQPGNHTIWFNNNIPWTAAITSTSIKVRNSALAELDLLVSGNRVRHRSINVSPLADRHAALAGLLRDVEQ